MPSDTWAGIASKPVIHRKKGATTPKTWRGMNLEKKKARHTCMCCIINRRALHKTVTTAGSSNNNNKKGALLLLLPACGTELFACWNLLVRHSRKIGRLRVNGVTPPCLNAVQADRAVLRVLQTKEDEEEAHRITRV